MLNYFNRDLLANSFKSKIESLLKSNGILYIEYFQNFDEVQLFPQLKSVFFSVFKEKSKESVVIIQNLLKDEEISKGFKYISLQSYTLSSKTSLISSSPSSSRSKKRGRSTGTKLSTPIIKKEKKVKDVKNEEGIEETGEEFYVEEVLDSRKSKEDGKFEYLLKWEGFDVSWNEWIHENNCSCDELIKKYWKKNKKKNI